MPPAAQKFTLSACTCSNSICERRSVLSWPMPDRRCRITRCPLAPIGSYQRRTLLNLEAIMQGVFVVIGALIFSSVTVIGAAAQGYVIQTPGQPPTNVNPSGQGRYIIQTPGQVPSNVNPMPGGGYVIQTPGQAPTNVNPMPGGGYRVQTPGQLPTYINPR
jgi:hypothetical protein